MRAVVQRVSSAAVTVADGDAVREVGRIGAGLLVLLGVEQGDGVDDVRYVAGKGARPAHLRRCRRLGPPDDPVGAGPGRRSAGRFSIHAGRRLPERDDDPRYDEAAPPALARPLYESVVREIQEAGLRVATGEFQAMMSVSLVNDGPVTLLLDSRKRF